MKLKNYIIGFALLIVGIAIGAATAVSVNSASPFTFEHQGMRLEISPTDNGIFIREYEGNRFIEIRPILYGMTYPPTAFPDVVVGDFDLRENDGTGVHMMITRNESITVTGFENGSVLNRFNMAYEDGSVRVFAINPGQRISIGDGMYAVQAPDFSQGHVHRVAYVYENGSVEVVENRWSGNPDDEWERVVVCK